VALDLGASRAFESCFWLLSDKSLPRALGSVPWLVPAQTVSFFKGLPASVFVLVSSDFCASASLERAGVSGLTVARRNAVV
jgi:hypothetical protein